MINPAFYQLGIYRITEYGSKQLLWERHAALGEQLSGNCFVCGDILIIGHCTYQEGGYLIGEFLEQLERLPVWNKTRYYCSAASLLDVDTGQSLTDDLLEERLSFVNFKDSHLKSALSLEIGTFRLGRYKIMVEENNAVSWQTYESLKKIVGGRCILESNLLFIGPLEFATEGQSRREFLHELEQLPKWNKTIAWSQHEVLLPCWQGLQTEQPSSVTGPQRKNRDFISDVKPARIGQYRFKETTAKLWSSGFTWLRAATGSKEIRTDPIADMKPVRTGHYRFNEATARLLSTRFQWLKTAWQRLPEGKSWLKLLIPLVVVGLLFGLAVTYHSMKRILPWGHGFKEHHHKHDNHHRR